MDNIPDFTPLVDRLNHAAARADLYTQARLLDLAILMHTAADAITQLSHLAAFFKLKADAQPAEPAKVIVDVLDGPSVAEAQACKLSALDRFNDALDSVLSYNCLAPYVFAWRDLQPRRPDHGKLLTPPDGYGAEHPTNQAQLQVIWMIAVSLFGDYGTSPRYGWIEDVVGFRAWCLAITESWRSSDEYAGPEEFRVVYGGAP